MSEYFIEKIFVKNVRDIIKDFEIPLSENERNHLIITGKNGSGKTSLLSEIDILFCKLIRDEYKKVQELRKNINNHKQVLKIEKNKDAIELFENDIKEFNKKIKDFSKVDLIFSSEKIYQNITAGKFILAFFKAKRENRPDKVGSTTKQRFEEKYSTNEELNRTFLQYLVNLKTAQAFAQIEQNMQEVEKIAKWFERFENALKEIFDKKDLKIVFNHKEFDFKIEYDNKSFGLNELSDGYSSFLAIVTELILRMEAKGVEAYDMQGVVLIDEIETHLHVELQKKVLPFLISFFPKIQFIVTTHSPFVLQSVKNAVICDLERREVTDSDRFVNASYSQIVKNYFEVDSEFSRVLLDDIKKYEDLIALFENDELDESKEQELYDLDLKLDKISPMLSDEIYLRFKEAQEKIVDG